jgi:nitrite reductase/ring-hydroxylating ferredoxin subunit
MTTIRVATSSQIQEGQLFPVKVENQKIILTRVEGKIHALENKCPHLGMPLAKGKVCNGVVTCPWHGASYNLTTGENVKWVDSVVGIPLPQWSHQIVSMGKKPQGLKTYTVSEQGDEVSISIGS